MVIRVKAAEVIHGAGACVVRCPPDVELGVGDGVFGNFASLDDFQRRLHGVEECHRAGFAGTEGNRLGNIAEDHIGGSIDLRDLVAAHRDIRQENTPRAVRGRGGGVAAVDLLNFVGHMGNRFPGGNVFLQDLQTGFYIVGEGSLHSTGTGQQGDVLMGAGLDIRLLHGLLGNAIHTGLEIGQCLFAVHGDGGGVAAGQRLHQKGRLDLGEGLGICLGDFKAGQRAVACGNSVLLVTVGHVHIDAVRGGVQGITLRSFHLHECPQALGDVLYLDNTAVFGHITADDPTITVDVEYGTIQTGIRSCNDFFEGDVRIAGRRIIRLFRGRSLTDLQFAGRIVREKTLAAGHAGFGIDRPFCGLIFHHSSDDTLGSVVFDLLLIFRVFLGFLCQEPIHITEVSLVSVTVCKAAGVNVTRGIATCGFIALMIPDIRLECHEQTAGDIARVVDNVGHHPLYILFGNGIHLTQPRTCDSGIPQGITVRTGGAFVGVAVEKRSCPIAIRVAEIHAVELLACCRGRTVRIRLTGGGQPGRPEIGVCGGLDTRSAAGGCQSRSGQQCQQGQQSQDCRQESCL